MNGYSEKQIIHLNFFSICPEIFRFQIYRKISDDSEHSDPVDYTIRRYRLPESSHVLPETTFRLYKVSLENREGFEPFIIANNANFFLSNWFLLLSLTRRAEQLGLEINSREGRIDRSLEIVTNKSGVGKEVISIKPYFLSCVRRLGFLLMYRFRKNEDQPFGVDVLKKSLALNSSGSSNANYYLDHFNKVKSFLSSEKYSQLFCLPAMATDESAGTTSLESQQQVKDYLLTPKTYVFREGATKKSQFYGVKECGAYESPPSLGRLVFLFREQDRVFSQEIYKALSGKTYAHTFPGMQRMFGFPMSKDTVSGFSIDNFEYETVQKTIEKYCQRDDAIPVVPVVIVPWSKTDPREDGVCDTHFRLKHQFLQSRIPSQFVSVKQLLQKDRLKWSTSNLGLGIFAKMGGKPWKLVPKTKRCLIIGIGQAQFLQKATGEIRRFYAYSVLTDSSGLYETIRVLANADNEKDYLDGLTNEIQKVIQHHWTSYDHFVLHSPFKIRREHMDRIKQTLDAVASQSDEDKYFL